MPMWWWHWHMVGPFWGWWMIARGFGFVLSLLLLIFLIAALFRLVSRPGVGIRSGVPTVPTSASELLDQRYARGEIGREEYLQKKADLQGKATPEREHGTG